MILLSNIFAIFLQHLAIKLGIVTNLDLAQACRKYLPLYVNYLLFVFCEIAIISCDLAEVIGTAIALNLLFGLPMTWGVVITAIEIFLILFLYDTKYGMRIFETALMLILFVVAGCFFALIYVTKPKFIDVMIGFIPSKVLIENEALYISIGIIGATVSFIYF